MGKPQWKKFGLEQSFGETKFEGISGDLIWQMASILKFGGN